MAPIKLIIFDCDGVLVDSEIIAAEVECERYRRFGLDMDAGQFAERFSGMSGERVLREVEALLARKLPAGLLGEIEAAIDHALGEQLEAIDGAERAIDRLRLPFCICSNSRLERIEAMLRRVGFHERFHPHIFSSHEVCPGRPKPAPDVYRYAMAQFGAEPQATVIVEDSVAGVSAGVAAGGRVVGFTGGRHSHAAHGEQLSAAGAETVIRRHDELAAVIEAFAVWVGVGVGAD